MKKKQITRNDDLFALGLAKRLIRISEDGKRVEYLNHGISRDWTKPEAIVEAKAYLTLALQYGYPDDRIRLFAPVTIGSSLREADIEVYADATHESPIIIVECKKEEVSEAEFRQAVEQAFSYAVSEGAKYVWTTSGIKNEYYEVPDKKPKARKTVADIPRFGSMYISEYRYGVNGGLNKHGQKTFALKLVTESELTHRFAQAHQALWGGGELNPSDAFDEFDKLIFCKIWDERKVDREDGDPYDFQIIAEDTVEQTNAALLKRLKDLYAEGRKQAPEVFKDDIRLSAAKVRTVVSYLEDVNLSETDLDSKGRAFETFMTSFFRGNFGQFFTPRPVVKFIVDVLPIRSDWRVLDTSCGSGGFLLHALDKVRKAAERKFGASTVGCYKCWHGFAQERLFGIEINEQIARTAKMNMIIHDDGHTNVVAADGLLPIGDIATKTGNRGFRDESFDCIITNPPFGSTIKQTEHAYLGLYNLAEREVDWLNPKSKAAQRPGVSSEILFIEQCWHFLVEGGYLAIVIPDGILTNASLQYVRDWIMDKFRVLAVVSLPQTTFMSTGAGVKSSVLFLRKRPRSLGKHLREAKESLQREIAEKWSLADDLAKIDKRRKTALEKLDKRPEFAALEKKVRKENAEYKTAADEIAAEAEKATAELRDKLESEYRQRSTDIFPDEDIFMAIAEDIGFDATGKATKVNELDEIGAELAKFIKTAAEERA
ncbi:MAG: N-6 DNA methylase [Kiritimatiellae bacterium]|nr:N-6 DNA methylase [Kiritimatiellia bacterium]